MLSIRVPCGAPEPEVSRMHTPRPDTDPAPRPPSFWQQPAGRAWLTVALILLFFLLREHWGHLLGLWPYLLLAACPLMHLLHGRHGHGGHGTPPTGQDRDRSTP